MTTTRNSERKGNWIQLISGEPFWPLDPHPEEIRIEDVAWALSMLCRFTGHVSEFYSVAEHSVWVSRMVPEEHALWALLHDATEAYVGDVSRPLKKSMPEYQEWEARLAECVAERFGLPWPMPECVHEADLRMSLTEREELLAPPRLDWDLQGESYPLTLECWSPGDARRAFLSRYRELCSLTVRSGAADDHYDRGGTAR